MPPRTFQFTSGQYVCPISGAGWRRGREIGCSRRAGFRCDWQGNIFRPARHPEVQLLDEKSGKISTMARLGAEHSSGMGITVSSDDHYLVFSDFSIMTTI